MNIIGWDVGAVHVKAAWLGDKVQVASQPLEIWHDKNLLPQILRSVYKLASPGLAPKAMAVTMTAELSDAFETKREGVLFILECLKTCFPKPAIYCLNLAGEFVPLKDAQNRPLEFASANWLASALWLAGQFPDCILLDVGSTTTDIIPILDGQVCASGRTDLERLAAGELVYTGALRTNLAAIVQSAPINGKCCRVASEYFAISGDVHLILGNITPQDYTCPSPDGKPASINFARKRLARLVCADDEMLSTTEIDELARYIYAQQIRQIQQGVDQVISRMPELRIRPAIVVGSGAFLGKAAAAGLGLKICDLAKNWGEEQLAVASCVASAHLLADHLR
jgi:probable H4MPT-linked C1 transfer pathway protein